jgi:hypothetical protein
MYPPDEELLIAAPSRLDQGSPTPPESVVLVEGIHTRPELLDLIFSQHVHP